jgi:hypothetical protein
MFLTFKLSFDADYLTIFNLATLLATFSKFGQFFSSHLVTLYLSHVSGKIRKEMTVFSGQMPTGLILL